MNKIRAFFLLARRTLKTMEIFIAFGATLIPTGFAIMFWAIDNSSGWVTSLLFVLGSIMMFWGFLSFLWAVRVWRKQRELEDARFEAQILGFQVLIDEIKQMRHNQKEK